MNTEDGLPPIREVLARTGHRPSRALGQNFIRDLNYTRRIVEKSGTVKDQTVLEIGPGPGGLTRALLLAGAARVIAIERDARCLEALHEIADRWPGRLEIIENDALQVDLDSISNGPVKIVANLPYGIAAALLVRWLGASVWPPGWTDATVMLQREMAERFVAVPGTSAYGRLTILAQWRASVGIVMHVPPEVFIPPPKVESRLVQFRPSPDPEPGFTPATLARVTAAAFNGRRKMLRRSMVPLAEHPKELLAAAGVSPELRADALPVAGYCALAREYEKHRIHPTGQSSGPASPDPI